MPPTDGSATTPSVFYQLDQGLQSLLTDVLCVVSKHYPLADHSLVGALYQHGWRTFRSVT